MAPTVPRPPSAPHGHTGDMTRWHGPPAAQFLQPVLSPLSAAGQAHCPGKAELGLCSPPGGLSVQAAVPPTRPRSLHADTVAPSTPAAVLTAVTQDGRQQVTAGGDQRSALGRSPWASLALAPRGLACPCPSGAVMLPGLLPYRTHNVSSRARWSGAVPVCHLRFACLPPTPDYSIR